MSRFKAAIIGGGNIAEKNHIPALRNLADRVEIVAVCSRDIYKAKNLADKFDIPYAFNDSKEMYASDASPDVIINCTANNLHYPYTMEALENNCHVLCEKPPAINAHEANEMAILAREKSRVLAYNFQLRHTSEYRLLKKCLNNGQLGEVYHIKANFLRRRGIPGWGNFTNKSVQGGGALMDLGVHILDLALGLLNYQLPDRILANTYDFIGKAGGKGLMGDWDPAKFEVEDACFAHLSFSNNASIMLSTSFALNTALEKNVNLEVFGSKAGALLNPFKLYSDIEGELADISFPKLEETDIQLKNSTAFIDACEGKTTDICSAEQGAVLQEIVQRIYQSAQSNQL